MSERINIKWVQGRGRGNSGDMAEMANLNLKRVSGGERLDNDMPEWTVHELPKGIAKKDVEAQLKWLNNQKHKIVVAEAEGFGEEIPIDAKPAGVPEGDQWWQIFVKVPQAWTVTKGLGAVGAITDNGLGSHPFTDPRLVETKIFDPAETDAFGGSHGNPVTGCTVGISPECGVTNYKIAGADGSCSWNDVSNAWLHAKAMGRKVVNTSWGGGSSILLQDTAKKLRDANIAVVVAAGNSAGATAFPANLPTVYAVSALDEGGTIASFSCRGKIDISAPGVNLLTTTSGGGWARFSGTSGAAPIITGLLLLILARNPSWTGVQAMERLKATATPRPPTTDYGAGWPDAARAVGADTTPPPTLPPAGTKPPTPTNLRVTDITPTSYKIHWDQATFTGGINRWEIFGGDYKADQVEAKYNRLDWTCLWWTYGAGPKKQYFRVRAVAGDGTPSDLSAYLDESLPPGTTPPVEPPPPDPVELPADVLLALGTIDDFIATNPPQAEKDLLKSELLELANQL